MRVKSITLTMRAGSVLKGKKGAVSDDQIGGWSEDTVGIAMSPNNVARAFGHVLSFRQYGPGVGAGAVKRRIVDYAQIACPKRKPR